MRSIAALLSLLPLAACASDEVQSLRPQEIAMAPYSAVVTASPTGTLDYEAGCLRFYDDHRKAWLVPVWPDGTIFNGTSVIFHKPGRADQPIVLKQEILLSGQPLVWSAVPSPRGPLFQRQCGGIPFAVAEVRPAN